jgi:hypothetical protein
MAGEFLTGNMDFFTIQTLVPMAQTNVDTPVAELYTQQGYSTWQDVVVVDGSGTAITYSTQTSYQDAFNKQNNFNVLLQIFALRANPVIVGISAQTVANPSITTLFPNYFNAVDFGSSYTSSSTVTTVKLATEKTGLWNVSAVADSNATGYQFLTALDAIPVMDLATPVLNTPVFDTTNATYMNTIAIRTSQL